MAERLRSKEVELNTNLDDLPAEQQRQIRLEAWLDEARVHFRRYPPVFFRGSDYQVHNERPIQYMERLVNDLPIPRDHSEVSKKEVFRAMEAIRSILGLPKMVELNFNHTAATAEEGRLAMQERSRTKTLALVVTEGSVTMSFSSGWAHHHDGLRGVLRDRLLALPRFQAMSKERLDEELAFINHAEMSAILAHLDKLSGNRGAAGAGGWTASLGGRRLSVYVDRDTCNLCYNQKILGLGMINVDYLVDFGTIAVYQQFRVKPNPIELESRGNTGAEKN